MELEDTSGVVTTQISRQAKNAGKLGNKRSQENQWPLPQTEGKACFRALIKQCFNAASAGSCISTRSHHQSSSTSRRVQQTGWLDSTMTCSCDGDGRGRTLPGRFAQSAVGSICGGAWRWVASTAAAAWVPAMIAEQLYGLGRCG